MGEKLYVNGTILTMEKQMYAEAVLVREGRIAAVGRKKWTNTKSTGS